MANRYWVGGTASWDATAGTKWATTSGGAGGAAVPTSADDVFFDANSGAVTVTVSSAVLCQNMNCTGFTGTIAGSAAGVIGVNGDFTASTTMTWTNLGGLSFIKSGACLLTSAARTLGPINVNGSSLTSVTLQDALTSSGAITVTFGTFTTNNYNVTATSISSSNSNTRTINLGSSTVTLSNGTNFVTLTGLTFNAGTSQINISGTTNPQLQGSVTYYNLAFTGANQTGSNAGVVGSCTFNNLSISGRTSSGVNFFKFSGDQTINGTLTLSAGTDATMRTFVQSDVLGTTRTLTVANFAGGSADIDFRDITIAGAASPISGTRFGDCKGNSGITFPAAKTVYWNRFAGGNWSLVAWAATSGGTADSVNFPLAQDAAIFESNTATLSNNGTVTVNANYNIGTIDMSARVTSSSLMTLATGTTTPAIYGNWINGTGTTLTGTNVVTFAGRGNQTITSAGKTFTQILTVNSPSGSVTLQDALNAGTNQITLTNGTFNANGYNVTAGRFDTNNTNTRTVNIGSGTWTLSGTGTSNTAAPWVTASGPLISASGLTVTGSGTLSFNGSAEKGFYGGGLTYPIINQSGSGILRISAVANTFADITNTYKTTGATTISFGTGVTQTFNAFSASGASGALLSIITTTAGTQATIALSVGGTVSTNYLNVQDIAFTPGPAANGTTPYVWYLGANSTNSGNNTGGLFQAGGAGALKVYQITNIATTSWTVPSDWNSSSNIIHLIGGGGGGGGSRATAANNKAGGGGGGGGGYTAVTNYSTTPSSSITVAVGTGGTAGATSGGAGGTGGTTSWAVTNLATGGTGGSTTIVPTSIGGLGGTGTYSGGAGGAGSTTTSSSGIYVTGGGGGGAAGPNGAGGAGGIGFANATAANAAGGGGGGNGGGTAGGNASSALGGTGGNNSLGTGGGASNTAGTFGGGGGGASGGASGKSGGTGIDILNTIGGGGGTGGSGASSSGVAGVIYGAGGSGAGTTISTGTSTGGAGAQGLIVIAYTPSSAPATNSNFFMMFI